MSTFAGLYNIRDANKDDANFIYATFLKGLYYGDSWFSRIPKQIFMLNYKRVAESLVKGNTVIKIACLPDDSSVILGYSILSKDYQTVHFCFVKAAWRKKGLARSLVPTHPVSVSHLTTLGQSLLPKLNGAVFNPFAII